MNTLEAIYTRRSIRKFSKEKVSQALIDELLKAAMSAPSAYNEQPWQFIVIDDPKLLQAIPKIHPHAAMCASAPLALLIAGDLRQEKSEGLWMQGCAAATQNLLLAAHDQGLGGVWTGIYPRDERMKDFQKLFLLPQEVLPFALVVLGHPQEHPPAQNRFRKERIHHNQW